MPDGSAGGGRRLADFQELVLNRTRELFYEGYPSNERGAAFKGDPYRHFVIPVALILVLDEANGGDATAQELIKRFDLLHYESGRAVDFYFLGWNWVQQGDRSKGIRFNMEAFSSCRTALRKLGIKKFGGNADLILVDAHHWFQASIPYASQGAPKGVGPSGVTLDFKNAIYVNMSSRRDSNDIPPLGEFLQSLIDAARDVSEAAVDGSLKGMAVSISNRLGIATATKSLLNAFLEKLGAIIGAKKLETLCTRNLGPVVSLDQIKAEGVA